MAKITNPTPNLFIILQLILFLLLSGLATAYECGDGTVSTITADYIPFPKLMLLSCEQAMGEYSVGGGSPPFELWRRDKNPATSWYFVSMLPVTEEARTFRYECSSDEGIHCGVDADIQVRDILAHESNTLAIRTLPCPEHLQWDSNNPQEINRETSVTIRVTGGFPLYTWQVSGTGFSLNADQTYDAANTLIADSSACGIATISVTDAQDETVTGYVRCVTGQWVLVCYEECASAVGTNCYNHNIILNDNRYKVSFNCSWRYGCDELCGVNYITEDLNNRGCLPNQICNTGLRDIWKYDWRCAQ